MDQKIFGRAMLANVSIRLWEGRKFDRKVTADVVKERRTGPDAGRWNKLVFGEKVPELERVLQAARRLRTAHIAQTLPWDDESWRILPSANFLKYCEVIRKLIAEYMQAVADFIAAFPRLKQAAKALLNGDWREEDYPDVSELPERFSALVDYQPLPMGEDFRTELLPEDSLEQIRADTNARTAKAVAVAMQDAWAQLGKAVVTLRKKLDDGKGLREPMIERLERVAEALGRMNITEDPKLEEVRKQVLGELAAFGVDELKTDDAVRAQAARAADDILKKMEGFFTPPSEEDA